MLSHVNVRPGFFAALVVALLLFALYGVKAEAQTSTACAVVASNKAHVCWSPVTTYTDGTAISPTVTVTYTVLKSVSGSWTTVGTTTATDWVSDVLPAGTHTYAVRATVNGVESDRSNSRQKTTSEPKPAAPVVTIARIVIQPDGTEREERVADLDLGYLYVIRTQK